VCVGLPALGRPKEGRHHSRRRIPTPTRPPAARRVVQSTTPTGTQCLPPSLAGLAGPVRRPSGPPHHPDYKFRPPVLRLQSPLPARGLLQAVTTRLSWSGASDSPPSDGRTAGWMPTQPRSSRTWPRFWRPGPARSREPAGQPTGGRLLLPGEGGEQRQEQKRRTPSLTLPAPSLASRAIPYALRPHK